MRIQIFGVIAGFRKTLASRKLVVSAGMLKVRCRNEVVTLCLLVTLGGLAQGAAAVLVQPFNELVFFGDSMTDTGNVYNFTVNNPFLPEPVPNPADGYAVGRFSNGGVYADYLSAHMGLGGVLPSTAGGNNYAWGGAGVTTPSHSLLPQSAIDVQIDSYLSGYAPNPHGLYVLSGGGNDILDALDDGLGAGHVVSAAEDLAVQAGRLLDAGVQNLVLMLVADISDTPAFLGQQLARDYSVLFNQSLLASMPVTAANLILLDTGAVLGGMKPLFSNTSVPCINDLSTCGDAMFFDDVHPTTAVHELLADSLYSNLQVVPLPSAIWLFLSALSLLGVATGRSRYMLRNKGYVE